MSLTYSVEIPQLAELQRRFAEAPGLTRKAVTGAVNRSLVGYQGTAKRLAPVDTGLLRGSISISPATTHGNVIEGSVGTNLKYALPQETGSGIYGPAHAPIRPKTAKVLRFFVKGTPVFARQVKGSPGRWYFKGSIEQNQTRTEGHFEHALGEVAQALAGGAR